MLAHYGCYGRRCLSSSSDFTVFRTVCVRTRLCVWGGEGVEEGGGGGWRRGGGGGGGGGGVVTHYVLKTPLLSLSSILLCYWSFCYRLLWFFLGRSLFNPPIFVAAFFISCVFFVHSSYLCCSLLHFLSLLRFLSSALCGSLRS